MYQSHCHRGLTRMHQTGWLRFQVADLGLLRDPDYLRLWTAQTVSQAGSGAGSLAVPLTAVLVLGATAAEMGFLRAATNVPALLLGLVVGVWIDRLRRRPLLVAADFGRALLLASIPLALVFGLLRMELLYAIAFLVGVLTLVFEVAVTSYLPTLVQRRQLVEANAKLQVGYSAAHTVGPAGAGWLIHAIGAPFALLADVITSLASGALVASIRVSEPAPAVREKRSTWREVTEGARPLWDDPILRATTAATTIAAFGGAVQAALLVLFATLELGLSAAVLGLMVASSGAAATLGAAITSPLTSRIGVGPALICGQLATAVGMLLIPTAAIAPGIAVLVLFAGQVLLGGGIRIFSVNQISLRQAITPPEVLGRVNATRRFLVFGIQPIGALIGGVVGSTIGIVPALVIGGAFQLFAVATLVWSPLPALRDTLDRV